MSRWQIVGTLVSDSEAVLLDGLNPWEHEWRPQDEAPVLVPHPGYPQQRHEIRVYTITAGPKTVRFAAGEFSNGAWGFFLPTGAV